MTDLSHSSHRSTKQLSPSNSEEWKLLRSRLLRYAMRCTRGDEHAAEDLVQHALAQALDALPPHVRSLQAWLQTVIANQARRTWSTRSRFLLEWDESQPVSLETSCPREIARGAEQTTRTLHLLETLAPKYRQPLELRYLGGWSIAEIAAALGVQDTSVRQQLKRALCQLRNRAQDPRRLDRGEPPGLTIPSRAGSNLAPHPAPLQQSLSNPICSPQ